MVKKKKRIFIVCRKFKTNSGSYAGMIEEFSKISSKRTHRIKILSLQLDKTSALKKKKAFAEINGFATKTRKIPLIGINKDYLELAKKVKEYFKKKPPKEGDTIIANSRAALGLSGYNYVLRMGQPSFTFLKNMELAKNEVSIFSRFGRLIHHTIMYFLEKKVVKNASALMVSSEESRQNIIKYYGGQDKPYFIPFSGVKYSAFRNGKKLPIKGKKLLFVSAGKEKIRKGVVYLERALPELFDKYEDLKLIHVGGKFNWDVPKKYQKRIISVGKVPWKKMKDYYATADLFVLTSLQEGFPNTILESMAAECPIVTSNIEGVEEYISHKKEGYIFKRGNTRELKKGIFYMLNNPSKAKKMGKKASKEIKKLDYEYFSNKFIEFLEKINKNKDKSFNLLKNG